MRRVDRACRTRTRRLRGLPDRCRSEPDEFTALFNTILINVTAFFRDAEAWQTCATRCCPRCSPRKAGEPDPGLERGLRHRRGGLHAWPSCSPRPWASTSSASGSRSTPPTSTRRRYRGPAGDLQRADAGAVCRRAARRSTSSATGDRFAFRRDLRRSGHLRPQRPDQDAPDLADRPAGLPQHADVLQRRDPGRDRRRFHFALADPRRTVPRQGRDAAQPRRPVRAGRPQAAVLPQASPAGPCRPAPRADRHGGRDGP